MVTLDDRALPASPTLRDVNRLALRALSRERAKRDLARAGIRDYGSGKVQPLAIDEKGSHPWCPGSVHSLRHSYVGHPYSTKLCRCALPGSSMPVRVERVP